MDKQINIYLKNIFKKNKYVANVYWVINFKQKMYTIYIQITYKCFG